MIDLCDVCIKEKLVLQRKESGFKYCVVDENLKELKRSYGSLSPDDSPYNYRCDYRKKKA